MFCQNSGSYFDVVKVKLVMFDKNEILIDLQEFTITK
jgi:hypothetical protein